MAERSSVHWSRRDWIGGALAGALALISRRAGAQEALVGGAELDHLILGVRELQEGIEKVHAVTGVRAVFGGAHPGRGTHNALLALDRGAYLEILAPDPEQKGTEPWVEGLASLEMPKLVGWAVRTSDIEGVARRLAKGTLPLNGINDGSRERPDGSLLRWRTLGLSQDDTGLMPFFIQWDPATPHPSADAPAGARLLSFGLHHPEPARVASALQALGLEASVAEAPVAGLSARIAGPDGELPL
ncbi:MAG: VOC family protein [Vicinamibacteria bacterium]